MAEVCALQATVSLRGSPKIEVAFDVGLLPLPHTGLPPPAQPSPTPPEDAEEAASVLRRMYDVMRRLDVESRPLHVSTARRAARRLLGAAA